MQYLLFFLFQGGVCELSWEMMISGVEGVWGRDCLFLPLPALLRSGIGGSGMAAPPCPKPPRTRHLPSPPGAPGPTVWGGEERGGGEGRHPPCRHWDTPERPPSKEKKKKIHLDCTLLLFIAYFGLSVVDNSLLSYIKKYLNDVQYAMP